VEQVIALMAVGSMCVGGLMLVRAVALRLQGKGKQADERLIEEVDDLRDRVAGLQGQLDEVLERQDFAERLLAQARERGLLGSGQ
jgi:hypothetical protein